ncbi:MAG: DnaJ domain-containing protein [Polyangiaceae bacterium]|nr:DnaJ domain-containing protein [Polyangiaceae bacterium]MCB9607053.1 DnaJ domain-containing protein [Polyangiaceae bacterium]
MDSPDEDEFIERLEAWGDVLDESTYYELLGVLDIADERSIKQAFHEFALSFHPDSHLDGDPKRLDLVRRVFKRGAEAYRVLMDPGLRSKYDLALAQGHLRLEAGEIPRTAPTGDSGIKTLEDICKTPSARLCASRADEYLNAGDMDSAKRELKLALYHDGNNNPDLEERIDAIDLAMFAMGD